MTEIEDIDRNEVNQVQEFDMEKEHFVETGKDSSLVIIYTIKLCLRIIFCANSSNRYPGSVLPGV